MNRRQDYRDLLDFWFSEAMRPRWFDSTPDLDRTIRERYETLWQAARAGELAHWENSPDGALALVIALDQLPLNMYRGRPEAFATERQAVTAACLAIDAGFDRRLPADQLLFLYLPFMHSEDPADQDRSVALFGAAGLSTHWAEHHREIVRRFGRFPHRNALLGRTSTAAERDYLASPQAFKG
jgi:uncharacterized protein (DUF924 family)